MESLPFIEWCLEHLNYFTITLLMIIESSFIPFPSEIVIPPAAYMAAAKGDMSVQLVVLFGTLGAVLGALVNYLLAYYLGRPMIHRFARSRVGGFLLLSEEAVVKAEQYFVKYGIISTLFGRLVPGIRQLISIPAGLAKMKVAPFLLYTALGAGVWNIILATLGWYAESVVPQEELVSYVTHYSKPIGYTMLGVVLLLIGYMILAGVRRPKQSIEN